MQKSYSIKRCSAVASIDANWNKAFWQGIEPVSLAISHWSQLPIERLPRTDMKMQYDDHSLYLIFRVHDHHVRAAATEMHGEVWKDSCVEFFFAPNPHQPDAYFNLETNCCGVLLAQHHTGPRQKSRFLNVEDCRKIRIAASASGPIRHEIKKPLTWVVEYALPLDILSHYMNVEKPSAGVCWGGNFYKCADESSCPHWVSWSEICSAEPDFHRPECFGLLQFT